MLGKGSDVKKHLGVEGRGGAHAVKRVCYLSPGHPFWGLFFRRGDLEWEMSDVEYLKICRKVTSSCMRSSGKTTFLSVLMERASYGETEGSVRLRLEPEDVGAGARSSYSISELR